MHLSNLCSIYTLLIENYFIVNSWCYHPRFNFQFGTCPNLFWILNDPYSPSAVNTNTGSVSVTVFFKWYYADGPHWYVKKFKNY